MKKVHYYYLDLLRIISAFCVIIAHLAAREFYNYPVSSFNWWVEVFFGALTRFTVPVFFMISGTIFLNPERNVTFKGLLHKNIKKQFIVLFFWSTMYAILSTIKNYSFSFNKESILYFLKNVFEGPYPFWFLFVMIGMYFLVPLLRKIAADRWALKYFLIISFITAILFPTIKLIPVIGETVYAYTQKFEVHMTVGYVFYFMLGHYLQTIEIPKYKTKIFFTASVLMIPLTMFLPGYISEQTNEASQLFYDKLLLNNMILSVGIFCFAKSLEEKLRQSKGFNQYIERFPKYMLGVYVLHLFFINMFRLLNFHNILPPILNVPLLSIVIFILCCITSYVIYNKFPKAFRNLV